jgi:3-oxoacyl-[acyl-carrier-protein] synthase II
MRRVVITGAGLVSPLGDTPAMVHDSLLAGRSGLKPVTRFATDNLPTRQAGEVAPFDETACFGDRNLRPLDRIGRLVVAAAQKALDASGLTAEQRAEGEVGLVLGTLFCGVHTIAEFDRRGLTRGPSYVSPLDFANTVINAAAGQTAIWHDLRGVNSTIAGGAEAGLQAIAYAAGLIQSGRAEVLLAGGADELCEEAFLGFCRTGRLSRDGDGAPVPFGARRGGFALAEGAALLVLEEAEAAAARGARILAEVEGWGESFDPTRGREAERSARAVARAVERALDLAHVAPRDIGFLSASANGSVTGDRAEAHGLAAAFGGVRSSESNGHGLGNLPVTAVKSMLGEALGASGAFQVISALETFATGRLPGIAGMAGMAGMAGIDEPEPGLPFALQSSPYQLDPDRPLRALINAFGFDGPCCSLVLAATGAARRSAV